MASKCITTILILTALADAAAATDSAEDAAACFANGTCPSITEADNAALLQGKHLQTIQRHGQKGDLRVGSCPAGQDVPCPGSGNMCAGDQCCPGTTASGGQTFPCPSASAEFNGCESPTKVEDCLATTTTTTTTRMATCAPAANVQCPGSNSMCIGDQCCPGVPASGGLTFPCPSASRAFNSCQSPEKVGDCLPEVCCMAYNAQCMACSAGQPVDVYCQQNPSVPGCGGRLLQSNSSKAHQTFSGAVHQRYEPETCSLGQDVPCPGKGNMCAGDQCCPRTAASGDKTFPCPSASAEFEGCESNTKLADCVPQPVGCCFSIGVGAYNAPCCLETEPGMTKSKCLKGANGRVGGKTGWSETCPTSAAEADDMID